MPIIYRSQLDTWLLVVLLVAVIACVGAGVVVVSRNASLMDWLLAALVAAPGAVLPLWLLASTHYTIETDHLRIRCGPVDSRIALSAITGITATRNPASSPALSLDRLRIDYGQGQSVMISPRDKEGFIRDLDLARARARAH